MADCHRDLVQLASKDRRPAKWSHPLKGASRGPLQRLQVVRLPKAFKDPLQVAFKGLLQVTFRVLLLQVAFKALLQVVLRGLLLVAFRALLLQVAFKGLRPDLEQNLQQGQRVWKRRLKGTTRS